MLRVSLREAVRDREREEGGGAVTMATAQERLPEGRFVLTGSVRQFGGRLRVTACLSNTRTETDVWTDAFSRDVTEDTLFEVQAEIAAQVADSVDRVVSSPPGWGKGASNSRTS